MLQDRLYTETVTARKLNCVSVNRLKSVLVRSQQGKQLYNQDYECIREGSGKIDNSVFKGS